MKKKRSVCIKFLKKLGETATNNYWMFKMTYGEVFMSRFQVQCLISQKAHKAHAWSAKFSKLALSGKFLKFLLLIMKNFYTYTKLKKNYVHVPLSLDSERYAIKLAIVHLQELAKFFLLFRVLRISGEREFGSKSRCRYK